MKGFIGAIIVLFIGVIAVGLYTVGSPQTAREYQEDARMFNDVELVSHDINWYFESKGVLPESLKELWLIRKHRFDQPQTYDIDYIVTSDRTYELCATFLRDPHPRSHHTEYTAGRSCFDFEVFQEDIIVQ